MKKQSDIIKTKSHASIKEEPPFEFEDDDFVFYPDPILEEHAWDQIRERYRMMKEEWDNGNSILCLTMPDAKNNLLRHLIGFEYPALMTAILYGSRFNKDFDAIIFPVWEYVRVLCHKYKNNIPEEFSLTGEISGYNNCTGKQFATYSTRTGELCYTCYSLRDANMYNSVRGKGKVPLTPDGQLIWEDYIPI